MNSLASGSFSKWIRVRVWTRSGSPAKAERDRCTYHIPQNLLKECKSLQNISLHDNPISMEQFQQIVLYLLYGW
ncbi:Plant intracellular Ras-group-related LRR protein 7 [Nymphaea thermarum]|nr:Plant intracellular Ras-group-related LRR protein 7 [Nymphaea thermarum]